jgi:hypothetical protein
MADHETLCLWNPARKACPSCKHDKRELNSNGMDEMEAGQYLEEWYDDWCDIDARPEYKGCIVHCGKYELKETSNAK